MSKPAHGESTISIIAAIVANLLIGIVKFIAAGISGSSAMISEGIHSFVDSGNGGLVLLGTKRALKKPDRQHPFGYGKELYFWTLIVSVSIFAVGGGFSLYEGITHIQHANPSDPLGDPTVSYIVLIVALIIEGVSLGIALKQFNAARGDTPALQYIRESSDPSLYTVVLEDTAAELGLVFALVGTFLAQTFQNTYIDGAISIMIGILLISVAGILMRESKALLVGEGLTASELLRVESIIENEPAVQDCGKVMSMFMGPASMLIAIDVTFHDDKSAGDVIQAIDRLEHEIKVAFPHANHIYIEAQSLTEVQEQAEYVSKRLAEEMSR